MSEEVFLGFASILILGIAAQWIAWRIKFPSIVLLLVFGIIAGPLTGFVDPDLVFGELLFPIVSISVAIILFEGGLSLNFSEYKETGGAVHSLIVIGAIVTWLLSTAGAYFIIGLDLNLSVLLGAILVVSGPTVIVPLLIQIRPSGSVSKILSWEGILIDPLGALLAVLVYELLAGGSLEGLYSFAAAAILKTVLIGGGIGVGCAFIIVYIIKKYWLPDYLTNPVTLMFVVIGFALANMFQPESGLLAATVMGIAMANQRSVAVKRITEFIENLRVLLISTLFIVLAARLEPAAFEHVNMLSLLFLAFLIVIVRPAAVFLSTLKSKITWREKCFLALVYPRGIVAAAVASVFALKLVQSGYHEAHQLVPLTFLVIVGTVTFYGLGAPAFARLLGVSQSNPQGVLIVGANSSAIRMAEALKEEGFRVLLVDSNRYNIYTSRLKGIVSHHGSIVSETIMRNLDLDGIGKIIALTANDGLNSLSTIHFAEIFGSSEAYQLTPKKMGQSSREEASKSLHGRFVFEKEVTYSDLSDRFSAGSVIKKTDITEKFGFDAFKALYGESAVPLFLITEDRKLQVFTANNGLTPKPGQTIISLVDPVEKETSIPVALFELEEKNGGKKENNGEKSA